MMEWTRAGDCLTNGDWRIFKYAHTAQPYYELWHWPRYIGRFNSADEAKQRYEEITNDGLV